MIIAVAMTVIKTRCRYGDRLKWFVGEWEKRKNEKRKLDDF